MSKQRVFVAGHRGMVGSAIVRQLEKRADIELVLRERTQLDLLDNKHRDSRLFGYCHPFYK